MSKLLCKLGIHNWIFKEELLGERICICSKCRKFVKIRDFVFKYIK